LVAFKGTEGRASPPQDPNPGGNHDKIFTKPLYNVLYDIILEVLIRFLPEFYKIHGKNKSQVLVRFLQSLSEIVCCGVRIL